MRPGFRTVIRAAVLPALSLAMACAPRDPLAEPRLKYPDASRYLTWRNYLLIRYPAESEEPAVLLRLSDRRWTELARSADGFHRGREVLTWIPELDESGVKALELR